jgi:hypothetical protein
LFNCSFSAIVEKCELPSETLYVTKNESVILKCNIQTVNYDLIKWFYGPRTDRVIIVAYRVGQNLVYSSNPQQTQFNRTDYVYNTEDSSLKVDGSKINFNVCYECEAVISNQSQSLSHYESYKLQLLGNIIYCIINIHLSAIHTYN